MVTKVNITHIWDPNKKEDLFSSSEARGVYFKSIKRDSDF